MLRTIVYARKTWEDVRIGGAVGTESWIMRSQDACVDSGVASENV